ncbi:MAG: hypothetical protein KC503_10380 [Myxococcales bacterium]|nr:hypothetical protein [Myxococcales bacterium]
MTDMALEYPAALIDAIVADASGASLPTRDECRELLDAAFYASVEREEGRALAFTLAFVGWTEIDAPKHSMFSALVFDGSLPLTVREIVKLAPALDHRIAAIGVRRRPEAQRQKRGPLLEIWGIFRHGRSEYERLEGLASSSFGIGFDYLKVSSTRPAAMDIDIGDSRVASLAGGTIERGGKRVFSEAGPVRDLLMEAARAQGDNSYVELVQRVVWTIRSLGHGGTLLVLPDRGLKHLNVEKYATSAGSRATDDLRDRHREYWACARKYSTAVQRARDCENAEPPNWQSSAYNAMRARSERGWMEVHRRSLRDAVRFFASLANVDGALVLGPDLHVLAFGAMIQTVKEQIRVVNCTSSAGDGAELLDVSMIGGARHQSAAHFCWQRPKALAVVVSQDGRVSCFYKDGVKLRMWAGVRLDRRQAPEEERQSASQ